MLLKMELVTHVNHSYVDGWLSVSITTSKQIFTFKIASGTRCCEDVDIKYFDGALTDLIGAHSLRLETNLKKEDIPDKTKSQLIITRLKQVLHARPLDDYGYILNRITYNKDVPNKVLYIIFTNTNINYGHRIIITANEEILLDSVL